MARNGGPLCGKATQRADELLRGLAAACRRPAAACQGPPCGSLVNGLSRAACLLANPREPSDRSLSLRCQGPPARAMGEALLRTDGLMALPWRQLMVCLSVARPRKGPTSPCEALPPPATGVPPPAKDHRAGRSSTPYRRADALLAYAKRTAGPVALLAVSWTIASLKLASARRLFEALRAPISASATHASFKIS